jgi:hypothetical protein
LSRSKRPNWLWLLVIDLGQEERREAHGFIYFFPLLVCDVVERC